MLGIGMGELLLILVVALLFVGPEKLPGAARAISKGLRQVRGAAENIKQTVEKDKDLKDALNTLSEARASLQGNLDDISGKMLGDGGRSAGKRRAAAVAAGVGVGAGAGAGVNGGGGGGAGAGAEGEPVTRISKPRYSVEKVAKVEKVGKAAKPEPGSTDS